MPGRHRIALQFLLPILLGTLLLTAGFLLFVPASVRDSAEATATRQAVQLVEQVKRVRGYYTRNVVAKLKDSGLTTSTDPAGDPRAIPFPATFVLGIGDAFRDMETSLRFYSPYIHSRTAGTASSTPSSARPGTG